MWVVVIGQLFGAGCTISAIAPTPHPNLLGELKTGGTSVYDVSDVPNEQVCSEHAGLKDFCVTGFRAAAADGLKSVVEQYVDSAKPGPQYRAMFRLVEFTHAPASAASAKGSVAVTVSMRWQFMLAGPDGQTIVRLARTTTGPTPLIDVDAAESAVGALLNAVFEEIAAELEKATWPSQAAADAAASEPAPPMEAPPLATPGAASTAPQ
jgi:hypothetical protein